MHTWQSGLPIHTQLRNMGVAHVLDGQWPEGGPVPSVRQWAVEFSVNPLTVAKAFQALLDEGILIKQRGVGSFVAQAARQRLLAGERTRFLTEDWPLILEKLKRLGLGTAELCAPSLQR